MLGIIESPQKKQIAQKRKMESYNRKIM